ncbi:MAG: GNAT family N-acetyltransferase [Proteiniphilum sp.]|jgi:predicted acetyltransferase|uniref:GNAT family N-acetyltransferase n=1 Tax=Proteiniphilum sp. TaxID=1926877 RepID=UPI002B20B8DA|nr:GNAT family N-acetyltransferase [Proteiniphilum sp.]MEA5127653.1 GNAT family N-acetyltransferase [Proteiniphilum sp.]
MIRFADEITRPQVRRMWKTVFGDPDDYMETYFRHKYHDENTLVYVEEGKVVASLQMLSYGFTFCGTEIPIIYLSGVSTLPQYRRKGYVRQLLVRSFEEAAHRDVKLMLLVPQEEWLLKFYDRYGFAQTFDTGEEELPSLKALIEKHPGDLLAASKEFDDFFRQNDMTIQKSFDDFHAMIEEAALFNFPEKRSLIGMARVIDAERLLSLFAARYGGKSFSITVHDELVESNNALFTVADGKVDKRFPRNESDVPDGQVAQPVLTTNIRELAELLLGYHTSEKKYPLNTLFPEKQPQMHFMLE